MNLQEAEQWIAKQPLTFHRYDGPDLNPTIPSMLDHFKTFSTLPSQAEFVESYLKQDFGKVPREYILQRVARTYPSLVRDWHLNKLMEDYFDDSVTVDHNVALDKRGVDFAVTYEGETFYIHAFVDTPTAWHYHRLKRRKVNAPENRQYSMALPRNKEHALGEFYVYTTADLDALVDYMKANL